MFHKWAEDNEHYSKQTNKRSKHDDSSQAKREINRLFSFDRLFNAHTSTLVQINNKKLTLNFMDFTVPLRSNNDVVMKIPIQCVP